VHVSAHDKEADADDEDAYAHAFGIWPGYFLVLISSSFVHKQGI